MLDEKVNTADAEAPLVLDSARDTKSGGDAEHAMESTSFGEGAPGRARRSSADEYGGGSWGPAPTVADTRASSSTSGDARVNTKRDATSTENGAGALLERCIGGREREANRHPAGEAPHESGAELSDGDGEFEGDCVGVTVTVAEAVPVGDEMLTIVDAAPDVGDNDSVNKSLGERVAQTVCVGLDARRGVGVTDCGQAVQLANAYAPARGLHVKPTGQGVLAVEFEQKLPTGHNCAVADVPSLQRKPGAHAGGVDVGIAMLTSSA